MDDPFDKDFEPSESLYVPPRRAPQHLMFYVLIGALVVVVIALLGFILSERVFSPAPQTQATARALQETAVALRATESYLQTQIIAPAAPDTTPHPDSLRNTQTAAAFATQAAEEEQTIIAAKTGDAEAQIARATQIQATLDALNASETQTLAARETQLAIESEQTLAAQAQETLNVQSAAATRAANEEKTRVAVEFAQARAAQTRQALDAFYAQQTRQALDAFYAQQTRQAQDAYYAEQTRIASAQQTAAAPTRAAQNTNSVRYWIECDSSGAARIFLYSNTPEWPQVRIYASIGNKNGEGPMATWDIQPKYIDPWNNRRESNVEYRITARFSDGYEKTVYVYYRYPSGCSPSRP